jgi:hypothetical protein
MAEWLKARASKACIPLRVSGVRIPLSAIPSRPQSLSADPPSKYAKNARISLIPKKVGLERTEYSARPCMLLQFFSELLSSPTFQKPDGANA